MDPTNSVLRGYGDFNVKSSGVLARMAKRVASDVAAALDAAGIDADVERSWSWIVARTDRPQPAARTAAATPGVGFARPAVTTDPRPGATYDAARSLAATGAHSIEGTHAVNSDRVGADRTHDFSNADLKQRIGRVGDVATGAAINLDDPDRTYRVEAREAEAFMSVHRIEMPGGLPVGSQGRVTGGTDPPVTMWRLLRHGCAAVPVYIDLGELDATREAGHDAEIVSL